MCQRHTDQVLTSGDVNGCGAWSNSAMDVVLGLLAKGAGTLPFAPLKEACEQLFRHSSGLLTPEGAPSLRCFTGSVCRQRCEWHASCLPFAPLKEACKQLFRHSCGLLTPDGVHYLIYPPR